jgi:hypothetical protein
LPVMFRFLCFAFRLSVHQESGSPNEVSFKVHHFSFQFSG